MIEVLFDCETVCQCRMRQCYFFGMFFHLPPAVVPFNPHDTLRTGSQLRLHFVVALLSPCDATLKVLVAGVYRRSQTVEQLSWSAPSYVVQSRDFEDAFLTRAATLTLILAISSNLGVLRRSSIHRWYV